MIALLMILGVGISVFSAELITDFRSETGILLALFTFIGYCVALLLGGSAAFLYCAFIGVGIIFNRSRE